MTNRFRCSRPCSSVLFNRDIPILYSPNNNIWASRLLTLDASRTHPRIVAFFSVGNYRTRMDRVEIVMFHCPEWGIGVERITLFYPVQYHDIRGFTVRKNVTITSCNSLVRVCIMCTGTCDVISEHHLDLIFHPDTHADWLHIAEVTFYFNSTGTRSCPSDIIIDTPTPLPPFITTPKPPTTLPPFITTPIALQNTTITAPKREYQY